jgi:phage baseplate assembly protein W
MPTFQTFKDLNITFKPHPVTGDLTVKKDEADIKQSVANLLLTIKGERLFNSKIGSNLNKILFEPLDTATSTTIQKEISYVIDRYERRVNINEITTSIDYDNDGYNVELILDIVGREDDPPIEIQFFLERSR